jgi:signal transduction histidine kinase
MQASLAGHHASPAALAQRVARTHGGELIVSAAAGGGFQARLQLPLTPCKA